MDCDKELQRAKRDFLNEFPLVKSIEDLELIKIKYLGRKGFFKKISEILRNLPLNERPSFGKSVNDFKQFIESELANKNSQLILGGESLKLESEKVDISLPGTSVFKGKGHILKNVLEEITDLFVRKGFLVKEGPNIETEDNNFSLLNFPPDHPARLMHDTFYVKENYLLRTHTSNVQVRSMKESELPLSIVAPGLCFRNEDISARSHVAFHQVEVFHIDRDVGLSRLTNLLEGFFRRFFGDSRINLRFRHSYFPFVEPGIEVDIECIKCRAQGCSLCKETGWLEVAGAGMIHPKVLKNGGIDSEIYSGYAIGMGVERLAMLRHEISDIRLFFENDIRFLDQF
ncbi:MAG: phenylalanine--tRNA ligase subunit alpha [Victivallaceae bacterium]